ncbi:carotene isomerase, partial [Nannochloropsis oceanica]
MPAAAPVASPRKGGHKVHTSSNRVAGGGEGQGNMPTLVLDNGAYHLKVGFAGDPAPRLLMPNCTAKLKGQLQLLVGDDIDLVNNTANLQYTRPFDRGYLTNWEAENQVWKRAFGETNLKVEPEETRLVVTEAPFTPTSLSTFSTQVIFEEFGFAA